MSFKKPSAVLRDANISFPGVSGILAPVDARPRHTDTMEMLSASVMIGYKKRPAGNYPTDAMKGAVLQGCQTAQKVLAHSANCLLKVVALRQDEPDILTQVLHKHFHLSPAPTDDGGGMLSSNIKNKSFALSDLGKHDRRWVIEHIRRQFLHLSFHLNTGVYVIDTDDDFRLTEVNGSPRTPGTNQREEAYVRLPKSHKSNSRACGFRNGEIHVNLQLLRPYSRLSYARVIIHEAVHKFLEIGDIFYAHSSSYSGLSLSKCLMNPDCYAWSAVSLFADSVLMGSTADEPVHWDHAPG